MTDRKDGAITWCSSRENALPHRRYGHLYGRAAGFSAKSVTIVRGVVWGRRRSTAWKNAVYMVPRTLTTSASARHVQCTPLTTYLIIQSTHKHLRLMLGHDSEIGMPNPKDTSSLQIPVIYICIRRHTYRGIYPKTFDPISNTTSGEYSSIRRFTS